VVTTEWLGTQLAGAALSVGVGGNLPALKQDIEDVGGDEAAAAGKKNSRHFVCWFICL
jgi:hypothetical protein